jgi:hypothetical protein
MIAMTSVSDLPVTDFGGTIAVPPLSLTLVPCRLSA